jgi:hypothetical protein
MPKTQVHDFWNLGGYRCTPDGIRTHATGVRGRRPRPLDDGGLGSSPFPGRFQFFLPERTYQRRLLAQQGGHSPQLGYQDSNLD